jgi:hypothetical protein
MNQNNIIAIILLITAAGDNLSREAVISPLVTVVFPTTKSGGVKRAMPRGLGNLSTIPMAGGNDKAALR